MGDLRDVASVLEAENGAECLERLLRAGASDDAVSMRFQPLQGTRSRMEPYRAFMQRSVPQATSASNLNCVCAGRWGTFPTLVRSRSRVKSPEVV